MSDNRISLQRDLNVSANKQDNNNNVEDLKYDKEENLEQLEDDINSGKLNEKHFATKEDFDKFILFLSSLLNKKIVAPSDKKVKVSHENIVGEKVKDNKLIVAQEPKIATHGDLKTDNSLQPQDKKEVIVTLPNTTGYENNQVKSNENGKALAQTPLNSEHIKTDNFDLAKQSDTIKLVINEKQVVVHTAGGNNLSMAGEDVGAKGDPAFLDDARRFAQEQGFKEKGGQQQQDQQHTEHELDDIDSIYFSKRT
ncbi:MAG: hypothetical protein ACRC92_12500 [Peptostreptococcaceae bacterium]